MKKTNAVGRMNWGRYHSRNEAHSRSNRADGFGCRKSPNDTEVIHRRQTRRNKRASGPDKTPRWLRIWPDRRERSFVWRLMKRGSFLPSWVVTVNETSRFLEMLTIWYSNTPSLYGLQMLCPRVAYKWKAAVGPSLRARLSIVFILRKWASLPDFLLPVKHEKKFMNDWITKAKGRAAQKEANMQY